MTQRAYEIYRYRIPVDSQVVLRNRFLKVREGLLVKVQCGENIGWGEIAPLPGFSQENVEEALCQTLVWLKNWNQARSENLILSLDNLYPSVAFGLSCALTELSGYLQEEGNYQTAPLCYGDPDELFHKLENTTGEKVGKIKVGLYEANRDGMIVNMFLEAIPDLKLRLDANRAWTPEKAQLFAKYIKPEFRQRIQFLEEPCKKPEDSLAFAKNTGIAIAWDETLRDPGFQLMPEKYLSTIVIKPTLVGSLQKCIALIQTANRLGMQAVISSSIESSFGLTQLARISAQYMPDTIPGLDTLGLMEYQLVRKWPNAPQPVLNLDDQEFIECVASGILSQS